MDCGGAPGISEAGLAKPVRPAIGVQPPAPTPLGQLVVFDQRQTSHLAMVMMQIRPQPPGLIHPLDPGGLEGSHAGSWVKARVRCLAFSTAMTKQTRSGPRLGNGAPVYL